MQHWAASYVTDDGRYISESHAMLHVLGADCPCNNYGDPPEDEVAPEPLPRWTAKFNRVKDANSFIEKYLDTSPRFSNIERKGPVVEFDVDATGNDYLFQDLLENVGYVGTTQRRPARLNGVKAPFVW